MTAVATAPNYGTRPLMAHRRSVRSNPAANRVTRDVAKESVPEAEVVTKNPSTSTQTRGSQTTIQPPSANKSVNDITPQQNARQSLAASRAFTATRTEQRRAPQQGAERRPARSVEVTQSSTSRRSCTVVDQAVQVTPDATMATTKTKTTTLTTSSKVTAPAKAGAETRGGSGSESIQNPSAANAGCRRTRSPAKRGGGPVRTNEKPVENKGDAPRRGEGEGAEVAPKDLAAEGGDREPSPAPAAVQPTKRQGSTRRLLSVRPEDQQAWERRLQQRRQQRQSMQQQQQQQKHRSPSPSLASPIRDIPPLRAPRATSTPAARTQSPGGGDAPAGVRRYSSRSPRSPRRSSAVIVRAHPPPRVGDHGDGGGDVRPSTDSTHNSDLVELWVRDQQPGVCDDVESMDGDIRPRTRRQISETPVNVRREGGERDRRGGGRGGRRVTDVRDKSEEEEDDDAAEFLSDEEESSDVRSEIIEEIRRRGRKNTDDSRQSQYQHSRNSRRPEHIDSFDEKEEDTTNDQDTSVLSQATSQLLTSDGGQSDCNQDFDDVEMQKFHRMLSVNSSGQASRDHSPHCPLHHRNRYRHHHDHKGQRRQQHHPNLQHLHHHRHHRNESPGHDNGSPVPSNQEQQDVDHTYLEDSDLSVKKLANEEESQKSKKSRVKKTPGVSALLRFLQSQGVTVEDFQKLGFLRTSNVDVNAMGDPHAGLSFIAQSDARPTAGARKSAAAVLAGAQALMAHGQKSARKVTASATSRAGRSLGSKTRVGSAHLRSAPPAPVPVPPELLPPRMPVAGVRSSPVAGVAASPYVQSRGDAPKETSLRRGTRSAPSGPCGAPGPAQVAAGPVTPATRPRQNRRFAGKGSFQIRLLGCQRRCAAADESIDTSRMWSASQPPTSKFTSKKWAVGSSSPCPAVSVSITYTTSKRKSLERAEVAFTRTTTTCGLLQRVGPRTTVRQLRRAFAELWGVPLQCLAIYFAGRRLPDVTALRDAGVRANDVLDVFMTPPPVNQPLLPSVLTPPGARRRSGGDLENSAGSRTATARPSAARIAYTAAGAMSAKSK